MYPVHISRPILRKILMGEYFWLVGWSRLKSGEVMEDALLKIGLPVKCRHCDKTHNVKPGTDFDGWSKSKISRKWSCPEHSAEGMDESFKRKYKDNTLPEKQSEPVESESGDIDELLNMLD